MVCPYHNVSGDEHTVTCHDCIEDVAASRMVQFQQLAAVKVLRWPALPLEVWNHIYQILTGQYIHEAVDMVMSPVIPRMMLAHRPIFVGWFYMATKRLTLAVVRRYHRYTVDDDLDGQTLTIEAQAIECSCHDCQTGPVVGLPKIEVVMNKTIAAAAAAAPP